MHAPTFIIGGAMKIYAVEGRSARLREIDPAAEHDQAGWRLALRLAVAMLEAAPESQYIHPKDRHAFIAVEQPFGGRTEVHGLYLMVRVPPAQMRTICGLENMTLDQIRESLRANQAVPPFVYPNQYMRIVVDRFSGSIRGVSMNDGLNLELDLIEGIGRGSLSALETNEVVQYYLQRFSNGTLYKHPHSYDDGRMCVAAPILSNMAEVYAQFAAGTLNALTTGVIMMGAARTMASGYTRRDCLMRLPEVETCTGCNEVVARDDLRECACGAIMCSSCAIECDDCGRLVCASCVVEVEMPWSDHDHAPREIDRYCSTACANKQCACGEHRFIPGPDDDYVWVMYTLSPISQSCLRCESCHAPLSTHAQSSTCELCTPACNVCGIPLHETFTTDGTRCVECEGVDDEQSESGSELAVIRTAGGAQRYTISVFASNGEQERWSQLVEQYANSRQVR